MYNDNGCTIVIDKTLHNGFMLREESDNVAYYPQHSSTF